MAEDAELMRMLTIERMGRRSGETASSAIDLDFGEGTGSLG